MKGCLNTFLVLFFAAIIWELIGESTTILLIILAFIVIFFIVTFIMLDKYEKQKEEAKAARRERARLEAEKRAAEKEDFDKGYYHGFIDGIRDANKISKESLFDKEGDEFYQKAYSIGYAWGYRFDPDSEEEDPNYPY